MHIWNTYGYIIIIFARVKSCKDSISKFSRAQVKREYSSYTKGVFFCIYALGMGTSENQQQDIMKELEEKIKNLNKENVSIAFSKSVLIILS